MQKLEPIKMSAWHYMCENITENKYCNQTYLSLKIELPFLWEMGFRRVTVLVN